MSVKLRFDSPSDGGSVHRSRSFTGFSSLNGRRRAISVPNSVRPKGKAGIKSPRMHLYPGRGGAVIWQPEQVDEIFQALSKGLKEHLDGHQAEMHFLSSQQKDAKRNSRLGFLYDLEKEIRILERYIRRLEFQISKVDDLYESYCIQWRLSKGAVNMKRAFSLSPSTRASRESLLELNRNHRHSLQDMLALEGELEILLGELHIKMKGLMGFARICLGDQYEVVVRLGRQRWRIKGRMESDNTQSWDEEEMIFLPHIHNNFEIKVMELKGLSWLMVGMVTCASAGFFVAKPQLMLVEVTELGTLKLQLEVTWNPFDSTDKIRTLSVGRPSVLSRKSSVHSWTVPNSPSFTEKYFISMVRDLEDPQGSIPSLTSKGSHSRGGMSLVRYLSDPAQTFITSSYSPQSANISRSNTPDILRQNSPGEPDAEEHDTENMQVAPDPGLVPAPDPGLVPAPDQAAVCVQSLPAATALSTKRTPGASGVQHGAQALRLGSLIAELEKQLQNQSSSEKEMRTLHNQIIHLATILKNDLSLLRSSSSEETLVLEEVLGSFDFLSVDLNADDDTSCLGSVRIKDNGTPSLNQNALRRLTRLSQDSQSASENELVITPLTSGNYSLDQTLETHLDICNMLLQAAAATDFSPSRSELLDEMSLQAEVLETISGLLLEKNDSISTSDILPKVQRTKDLLMFWEECLSDGDGSPFCCQGDSFCRSLRKRYTHKVKAKEPGQSEKVFSLLLQEVQAGCRAAPNPRPLCAPDKVTIFQLSVYLRHWDVQDLGEHISHVSKEEYILSALRGPKRRRALNKLRGRDFAELLPLQSTLRTLAALQVDAHHKVCKAAASCLGRAAGCRAFRSKAVVFYTESLKHSDVRVQQASCVALRNLRAVESVDQIAELWRSVDEDLRNSAKETVISFGKKGYEAFQRMEQLLTEMEEVVYRNQETEITIL